MFKDAILVQRKVKSCLFSWAPPWLLRFTEYVLHLFFWKRLGGLGEVFFSGARWRAASPGRAASASEPLNHLHPGRLEKRWKRRST